MEVIFNTEIDAHRHILECAAIGILENCGNSYINAYTEILLYILKNKGVYNGSTIGNIVDIKKNETTSLDKDDIEAYMLQTPKHRNDEYIQSEVRAIENQEKELTLEK